MSAAEGFKVFHDRLNFLQNLLANDDLKCADFNDFNSKLCVQIENLKKCVSSPNCLTAGGKFEWVDSVLVKVRKYLRIWDFLVNLFTTKRAFESFFFYIFFILISLFFILGFKEWFLAFNGRC